jgi:hypothetical protein
VGRGLEIWCAAVRSVTVSSECWAEWCPRPFGILGGGVEILCAAIRFVGVSSKSWCPRPFGILLFLHWPKPAVSGVINELHVHRAFRIGGIHISGLGFLGGRIHLSTCNTSWTAYMTFLFGLAAAARHRLGLPSE